MKKNIIITIALMIIFTLIVACTAEQLPKQTQPQEAQVEQIQIEQQPTEAVEINPVAKEVKTKQVADNSNNADIEVADNPIKTAESEKTKNLKEIEVSAFKYGFSPSPIIVNKGDYVRLLITTEDVAHGFALPDYGISAEIKPGKTTIVEFLADKQGEFTIFCSVFCGSGHGNMKGTLVVK